MLKHIVYKKADGTQSDRYIHIVSPIQDSLLAIDLTEFTEEQRELYDAELAALHREYLDSITDLGLSKHWRRFKKEGITE